MSKLDWTIYGLIIMAGTLTIVVLDAVLNDPYVIGLSAGGFATILSVHTMSAAQRRHESQ